MDVRVLVEVCKLDVRLVGEQEPAATAARLPAVCARSVELTAIAAANGLAPACERRRFQISHLYSPSRTSLTGRLGKTQKLLRACFSLASINDCAPRGQVR